MVAEHEADSDGSDVLVPLFRFLGTVLAGNGGSFLGHNNNKKTQYNYKPDDFKHAYRNSAYLAMNSGSKN